MRGKWCLPTLRTDKNYPEKAKGDCVANTSCAASKCRGSSPFCSKDSTEDYRHHLWGISLWSKSNSFAHNLLLLRKYGSCLTKEEDISTFLLHVWKAVPQRSCNACKNKLTVDSMWRSFNIFLHDTQWEHSLKAILKIDVNAKTSKIWRLQFQIASWVAGGFLCAVFLSIDGGVFFFSHDCTFSHRSNLVEHSCILFMSIQWKGRQFKKATESLCWKVSFVFCLVLQWDSKCANGMNDYFHFDSNVSIITVFFSFPSALRVWWFFLLKREEYLLHRA